MPASHGHEGAARQERQGWNGSLSARFPTAAPPGAYTVQSTYKYVHRTIYHGIHPIPHHHTRTEWEVGTTTDAQIQIQIPRERGIFFFNSGAHQQRMTSCHSVTQFQSLRETLAIEPPAGSSNSTETEGGHVLRNSIMLPFPVPFSVCVFLRFSLFCWLFSPPSLEPTETTSRSLLLFVQIHKHDPIVLGAGSCPFLSTPLPLPIPPTRATSSETDHSASCSPTPGVRVFKYRDLLVGQHGRLGCILIAPPPSGARQRGRGES